MRRISNKLKAVVISLVSLVIVAGGVLGGVLIYRNNNKGGNGGGNPGSGGISTDLTEAQRELASAINSSATLDVTEPEKELVEKYEKKYQVFKKLYPALKPVFDDVVNE